MLTKQQQLDKIAHEIRNFNVDKLDRSDLLFFMLSYVAALTEQEEEITPEKFLEGLNNYRKTFP